MLAAESHSSTLARITVYPIKSLPGTTVTSCRVLENGALDWDRRFALVGPEGEFVNAKSCRDIHSIRADFQLRNETVRIWTGDSVSTRTFHLIDDRESIGDYLTCVLDREIMVVDNPDGGFPDDTDDGGPTVVSTATLEAVANLFPDMSLEQARWRFRANLELGGVPAFWEDCLFDSKREPRPFQIGSVTFGGTKPCQRCSVPSRHPVTGDEVQAFATILAALRKAMMPGWTNLRRFDHFYRLATNTVLLDAGSEAEIRTGNRVTLSTPAELQNTGS